MYLSSIDIFGFKSFAQKTKIEFAPGVTAIVGPNGCGKSNIVDAVRWVLGEQRESHLRSERMENVIFSGTEKRRPLGMAEISLTLNDAEGVLPIEYDEVTVTRRLFRSGKSEYLLNKTVCRLKDLVDLFMDTGIGPDSYSIIELKMVEGILSEDPVEMRKLFDEATGITRYKVRRREALRRLLEARSDRERALDILAEVEKQANALKRQVGKVRSYKRLQERLKRIRASMVLKQVQELEARLAPLGRSGEQFQGEMERLSAQLSGAEAEAMRFETELMELEEKRRKQGEEFGKAQSTYQNLASRKAHIEEELRLNQWRQESNRQERDKITEDIGSVKEQISSADEQVEAFQDSLPTIEEKLASQQEAFNRADRAFHEARRASIQCRENLDHTRSNEAETIRKAEERKAIINSLKARQDELLEQITERERYLRESGAELTQSEQEVQRRTRHLEELRVTFNQGKEKIETLREQIREHENELNQVKSQTEKISLQMEHFRELHRRSSPVYSAGGLLATEFPDLVSATLSDELQTDAKYVRAVESALLSMAFSRVLEHRTSFETILKGFQSTKAGRAALLVGTPPDSDPSKARRFAEQSQGTALYDVIAGDTDVSNWIRHFLRNIVFFETLDQVLKAAPEAKKLGISLVSGKGEFTDGEGLWIIGEQGEEEVKSIGVSDQLKELAQQLQDKESLREVLLQKISDIRNQLAVAESEMLTTEKHQRDAEQAFDLQNVTKLKLEAQIASVGSQLTQLKSDADQIPEKIRRLTAEDELTAGQLTAVLDQINQLEEELKKQQAAEAETLDERETTRQTLAEVQIEVERSRAEATRAHDRLNELTDRKERLTNRIRLLYQEEESLKSGATNLAGELEEQKIKVTEAGGEVENLRQKLDDIDAQRKSLQEELRSGSAAVRDIRFKIEELSQKIHQIQLEKVQVEASLNEARPKLQGIDLAELDTAEADPDEAADIERKLVAMEPLNLAAEQEYEEQRERLEFLQEQLNDLNDAEKSLEETISTLNNEAKERFEAGFERIRENFKQIFREIFEGGDADFKLTHEDSLESRVEIFASPGGKKSVNLSLLSGGEKALTAISLLFAIYMEKPSPFCILDEVDAPLDDENTLRFAKLLNKFTPTTQFLVVTHNKRTMEVAQNLLGVTMEEDGISKVVPVQLN